MYVKNILEIFVGSVQEVFEIMAKGSESRKVSSTKMNEESSRSHSIFVLQVTQKHLVTGSQKTGRLSLVDLAGSEKVGKTGATGQTYIDFNQIGGSEKD